jgi:hypothetical protein
VSVLEHASAHKWGKVQVQHPCTRFGAAGSSSGAANAVSLFNSHTSYDNINVTVNQNYFEFEDSIWQQTDGMPVGSPISSIFAEIFLQETKS